MLGTSQGRIKLKVASDPPGLALGQRLTISSHETICVRKFNDRCLRENWGKQIRENIMTNYIFVKCEVFTAVTMKNAVFWDVALCRSCVNRRFEGTYRLHLQGIKTASEKLAWTGGCRLSWVFSTVGSICSHLLTLVPRSRIFLPCRWRRHFPPKRRFTQDLHSATSQKTAFFELYLAAWIVLGLFKTGLRSKLKLRLKEYGIAITAFKEKSCKDAGILDTGNFTVFYSRHSDKYMFGTDFFLIRNTSISWLAEPESEILCVLGERGYNSNATIMCVHIPTEEKDYISKYSFCNKLATFYHTASAHYCKRNDRRSKCKDWSRGDISARYFKMEFGWNAQQ
jgi:hypothetical protein